MEFLKSFEKKNFGNLSKIFKILKFFGNYSNFYKISDNNLFFLTYVACRTNVACYK